MEVKQALEEIKNIARTLETNCELDNESREALSKASYALAIVYGDSKIREKSKVTINTLKSMRGIIEWDCPLDYSAALDEAIEAIQFADSIASLGSCNDCGNYICEVKPGWGKSQRYNCPHYKKNYQVGDVITDGKCNYLIISIGENSYYAIQGTDFEPVSIGKDFINQYKNLNDGKDMKKFIQTLTEKNYGE